MNHAITIRELMLGLGAAGGLLAAGYGALKFCGGMMSDDPYAADSTGKAGCQLFAIGMVMCIGCIVAIVL